MGRRSREAGQHREQLGFLPVTSADTTLHAMIFRCGWTPAAASPHVHQFAEPSAASARSEVALAGRDGQRAADLLAASKARGASTLSRLTERAVRRLLALSASTGTVPAAPVLFDDAELKELQDAFQATIATADLLGRSRVRRFAARHAEAAKKLASDASGAGITKFADPPARPDRLGPDDDPFDIFPEPIPFQPPAEAVSYFNRLIPSIGTDPYRYGALLERHAFTLAAAADMALLDKVKQAITKKVQGAIGSRIAGDPSAPLGTATADVQDILDAAGVSSANPQYAEMLVRSNLMDAYNHGQMAEMARPEMREKFPVWRYEGIRDGRQGKDHEPKFDKYYPSTAIFADVRGPRVWNCRCCATPLFHTEWAELQAKGARVESSW